MYQSIKKFTLIFGILAFLASCSNKKSNELLNSNKAASNWEISKYFRDSVAYKCGFDTSRKYNTLFKRFAERFNLPIKNYDFFSQLFYTLNVDTSILESDSSDKSIRLTVLPSFNHPFCLTIKICSLYGDNITELKLRQTDGEGVSSGMPFYEKTKFDSTARFEYYAKVLEDNNFWNADADNNIDSLIHPVCDGAYYRLESNNNGRYNQINFSSSSYSNKKIMNIVIALDSVTQELLKN